MRNAGGMLPLEFLAGTDLFRGLPAPALADVARQGRCVNHPRGSRISQGVPVAYAHVVTTGRVKIVQSGPGGEQLIVRFIRPGESFGTLGLYIDDVYPAEAVAMVDVVEARWTARAFGGLVHKHPEIGLNLVRLVGARLKEVQARLREMSTERVEQRVARALMRIALQERSDENGVRLTLTRRDIAELAGTTLFTASRILKTWERAGLASSGRGSVTILRPGVLAAISSGRGA